MKTDHIIVGEPNRCLCGVYGAKPTSCAQIIAALEDMDAVANLLNGPSEMASVLQGWSTSMHLAGVRAVKDSDDPMEALLFRTRAALGINIAQ